MKYTLKFFIFCMLAVVMAASACYAGITSVNISKIPTDGKIAAKKSFQYYAVVKDQNGIVVKKGFTLSWSTSVTGGTITKNGKLTVGTVTGTYVSGVTVTLKTITLENNSIGNSKDVIVVPAEPKSIIINPAVALVKSGEQTQFSATVVDAFLNQIDNPIIKWTCNKKAGIINEAGLFTGGVVPGKYPAGINANFKSASGKANITITPDIPSSVKVFVDKKDVTSGANIIAGAKSAYQFNAAAFDKNGNSLNFFTFVFNSTGNAGTITTKGKFTPGTKLGTGEVSAQAVFEGVSYGNPTIINVNIIHGAPTNISITPGKSTLTSGQQITFSAEIKDKFNNPINDAEKQWLVVSSSGGTFTGNGVFTASALAGKYTIFCHVATSAGNGKGKATVDIISESANDHLQNIINKDNVTTDDVPIEAKWFSDYHKAHPDDPIGILGDSMMTIFKAAKQLTDKYGITPKPITKALSFANVTSLVTKSDTFEAENTVNQLLKGNSSFSENSPSSNIKADESKTFDPKKVSDDIRNVFVPAVQKSIFMLAPILGTDVEIGVYNIEGFGQFKITGDEIRAYRAGLEAFLASLSTVLAYNWDPGTFNFDIPTKNRDKNGDGLFTPSEYMPTGSFGTLAYPNLLSQGWDNLNGGLADAKEVVNQMINAPESNQLMIRLANDSDDFSWVDAKVHLDDVGSKLNGPFVTDIEYEDLEQEVATNWVYWPDIYKSLPVTLDISSFWKHPILDLKTKLPTNKYYIFTSPNFGNNGYVYEITALLPVIVPDLTMGGLLPNAATEIPADAVKYVYEITNDTYYNYYHP